KREAAAYWIARSSRAMTALLWLLRCATTRFSSDLPQQRIAAGDFDLAGRRLEVELLDHTVFHQHRIALGADAEAVAGGVELHADRLGEVGVAVGEEHRLVALVGVALPGVHDEGVVDGDDGDGVHALVL